MFKAIVVLVYFLVAPFLLAPKWCMDYGRENGTDFSENFVVDCEEASQGKIRYSGIISLSPLVTGIMDLVCIGFLLFYRLFKITWNKEGGCKLNFRTVMIFAIGVFSLINSVLSIIN